MDEYRQHHSRTAGWTGSALAPLQSASDVDTEVWFALPSDSGDVFWEGLNAKIVGPDLVQVRAVPAWVYGVNFGDTVATVRSAEGSIVGTSVSQRGDQATFRVWLGQDPNLAAAWLPIAERYSQRGCLIDAISENLIALSCSIGSAALIRELLIEEERTTALVWEDGGATGPVR
jgi:hypothetical protein